MWSNLKKAVSNTIPGKMVSHKHNIKFDNFSEICNFRISFGEKEYRGQLMVKAIGTSSVDSLWI